MDHNINSSHEHKLLFSQSIMNTISIEIKYDYSPDQIQDDRIVVGIQTDNMSINIYFLIIGGFWQE